MYRCELKFALAACSIKVSASCIESWAINLILQSTDWWKADWQTPGTWLAPGPSSQSWQRWSRPDKQTNLMGSLGQKVSKNIFNGFRSKVFQRTKPKCQCIFRLAASIVRISSKCQDDEERNSIKPHPTWDEKNKRWSFAGGDNNSFVLLGTKHPLWKIDTRARHWSQDVGTELLWDRM